MRVNRDYVVVNRDYVVTFMMDVDAIPDDERCMRFAAYGYADAAAECKLAYPTAHVLDVDIA